MFDGRHAGEAPGRSNACRSSKRRYSRRIAIEYNRLHDGKKKRESTPEGYQRHVISAVANHGDSLTIKYGGRVFGGIMLDRLPAGVAESIHPGTEVIVRFHTAETGYVGQVAHILVPHPCEDGWAEIYADY